MSIIACWRDTLVSVFLSLCLKSADDENDDQSEREKYTRNAIETTHSKQIRGICLLFYVRWTHFLLGTWYISIFLSLVIVTIANATTVTNNFNCTFLKNNVVHLKTQFHCVFSSNYIAQHLFTYNCLESFYPHNLYFAFLTYIFCININSYIKTCM